MEILATFLWIWTSGDVEPLDITWLLELTSQLSLSDLFKSIIASISYLIIASHFFINGDKGDKGYIGKYLQGLGVRSKQMKCAVYFLSIFFINVLFVMNGWEIYANYILLAITTLFIVQYGICRVSNNRAKNFMIGFNFALTILVAFQWAIAFVGSIAFLTFPHEWLPDSIAFLTALSVTYIGAALLLRRFRSSIFRMDMSYKLLLIDIGAKLFFIMFFNLFFPRYFAILGMEHYSVLTLVLLTVAVIFTAYREYSVSLEKRIAVYNRDQFIVAQWAQQTLDKHEGARNKKATNTSKTDCLNAIENPILQALLYELLSTGERLGISVDILVDSTSRSSREKIKHINLNNYDLYSIINAFITNALYEAKIQDKKSIHVEIENEKNFCFKIQTYIEQVCRNTSTGAIGTVTSDSKITKDAIVNEMIKNPNITISFSKVDSFIQILRVA